MTETNHNGKTDGTIIIRQSPLKAFGVICGFIVGLTVYFLFFGAMPALMYRAGGPGGYASHRMPPILSNITGLSLFIAPFVQIPTTLFALIGGLIRNKIISNCIAWPLPILQILWMICEIPHGETTRGVGTLLTTRASPFSLKLIITLESYLIPCLMSVIWVYFIVQIFIPTVKNSVEHAP
ncbi:hypothetical protein A0U89_15845 (plasmid) [Kozakia baliensis]|uniref:Uncharacterized protein n=2 Tax=Kozakia baliensis TaxID=153496 RepID=A0A1D8UYU1_9PROT|nr:hypothetical protein A0U89_15845 [Kozakia baliensis]